MKIKIHKIFLNRNCGFFSDFLTIIAGIMYCKRNNIPYVVDWQNNIYGNCDENLFDKYFNQNKYNYEVINIYNNVTPLGYYFPDHVNFKTNKEFYNHYLEPSILLKELNILDNKLFHNIEPVFGPNQKVLGVHKRGTDHSGHGEILYDDIFFEYIDTYLEKENFDKVFLITDDTNSLESFYNKYGNMLLFTDSYKNGDNRGVHSLSGLDKEKLSLDVIRDAYLLSMTDFKIVTKSNVSTFSLLCNLKEDNFIYIDNQISYS